MHAQNLMNSFPYKPSGSGCKIAADKVMDATSGPHLSKAKVCLSRQAGLYTCLLPSLFFTYLGQAAYLVKFPAGVQSVYYNSLPHPIYWPMFVIATLASIVASQVRSIEQPLVRSKVM